MSKQLKYQPLSQAKINAILNNNPSQNVAAPMTVITPAAPTKMTLRRSQDYDSLQPEEQLKAFLGFARSVLLRYEENQRLQSDLETETQDMLHYMEMHDNMNAVMGNEMYKKLREIRRRRRDCKNEIELLKPVYDYLSDKTVINALSKIQGQCRASKETIGLRSYTMRTDVIQ